MLPYLQALKGLGYSLHAGLVLGLPAIAAIPVSVIPLFRYSVIPSVIPLCPSCNPL